MFSGEFGLYRNDPKLPKLGELSLQRLQDSIQRAIPAHLLHAPACTYRVTNVRYKPSQKLVVGLASNDGGNPVGVRVFPQEKLESRLAKARREHPGHTFLLSQSNAVAWVFPAERKLKLKMVADNAQLSRLLRKKCGVGLKRLELAHFVPEHSYTARVVGEACDGGEDQYLYLKIYYNEHGAHTADIMRQLAVQIRDKSIAIPSSTTYLSQYRMLLQSALPRSPSRPMSMRRAAQGLAEFHSLTADAAKRLVDVKAKNIERAIALVDNVFPAQADPVRRIAEQVQAQLDTTAPGPEGLLHGDAHLGNLFTLTNGKTGFIDLDGVAIGPREHDLASFFAFKLWLAIREQRAVAPVVAAYPDFIAAYNEVAREPVSLTRAFATLAEKMLTERIVRGISRGKLAGESEVTDFLDIASMCLKFSERRRV